MVDFDALALAPCLALLGNVRARYLGPGNTPVSPEFSAILDRAGARMAMDGDGAPVQVRETRLGVRLADLPPGHPVMEGTITVGNEAWMISEVIPDGLGGAQLVLTGRRGGTVRP